MFNLPERNLKDYINQQFIIDQISFFSNQFEVNEDSLSLVCNLDSPQIVVPLLYLVMRLREENYPHKFERMINESVLSSDSQVSIGISLFIDELLSSNKFSDGGAKDVLAELAEEITIWDGKNGISYLIESLIESLKKYPG